jgi:hypothetical protein
MIYGYGVLGGALNLNSTNDPDHGHHGDPPISGKNRHGRAGNQTRDLMISSQKGLVPKPNIYIYSIYIYIYSGTSVHELNPFLEAVREPKCS